MAPGVGGGGADWFGPSIPLPAAAPPEVRGRSWDYPVAYNVQQQKRPYELSFAILRALADSWDVLRTVIETRKDQMSRQKPKIMPRDPKADIEAMQARIDEAQALIDEPYPGMEWEEWLRRILEDLFVLDAPTAYVRKTMAGDIYGIKPLDGGTINRVLDPWGDTPEQGAAYIQILKGIGAVHYERADLIYRPRNPRNGRAFGFGPVEQIITIINIAIRRETWQLSFFTEGNLPDALIGVPMEWTPDQIRNFQDWFDARLAGETSRRRGATFVPGDVAKGYVATKDTELFGKAEEWLARVVCFAFSISPQAFAPQMNRATAETAETSSEEEGLDPIKAWVSGFWNYVFKHLKGWDDIKLGWEEEDDTDPKVLADIQKTLVDAGIRTRNQARKVLGDEPDPAPEADMLTTSTTITPISLDEQLKHTEAKQALMPDPIAPGGAPGGFPGKGPPKPKGSGPGGSGREGKGGGASGGESGAKPPRPAPKADKAAGVKAEIGLNRPAARRARAAIKRAFSAAFKATADDVAAQVLVALGQAEKARKADEPIPPAIDIDALVASLDLSSLEVVVDATDAALYDLALDSAKKAIAQLGVILPADLVDQVNEAAVKYARDRAAELVGKRWTAAGDLIDNPNPKWSITETTRKDLRSLIATGLEENIGRPAIAERIQEAFAFSEERAETISLTEIAFANEQSKMEGWRVASEEGGVTLKKGWQTSNDEEEVCEECQANEAQGLIGLEDDFESGDDAAPAHPNCQCVTYVEVDESTEGGE